MDHPSPELVVEDGLHTYHEAPQPYNPVQTQNAYFNVTTEKPGGPPVAGSTGNENHTIGGLRPRVFWSIIAVVSFFVIAASVGGAVGGTRASQNASTPTHDAMRYVLSSTVSRSSLHMAHSTFAIHSSSGSTSTSLTSTSSATPIPLVHGYNITIDCPNSDGTTYTAGQPPNAIGTNQYSFKKSCRANTGGIDLVVAFVPDFNTCIDLCSNWNYRTYAAGWSTIKCTGAVFAQLAGPPANCFAKNGTDLMAANEDVGTALLVSG